MRKLWILLKHKRQIFHLSRIPINLKKSHWQFYKKKIVSLVKRHQGIRKRTQGLKVLEHVLLLLFSTIVISIHYFVPETYFVVEFHPLFHVVYTDRNICLKSNHIYFRRITIYNKHIIIHIIKHMHFKEVFL